jgi:hypothetical protein
VAERKDALTAPPRTGRRRFLRNARSTRRLEDTKALFWGLNRFLANDAPQAFERDVRKAVRQLLVLCDPRCGQLASPHSGEAASRLPLRGVENRPCGVSSFLRDLRAMRQQSVWAFQRVGV